MVRKHSNISPALSLTNIVFQDIHGPPLVQRSRFLRENRCRMGSRKACSILQTTESPRLDGRLYSHQSLEPVERTIGSTSRVRCRAHDTSLGFLRIDVRVHAAKDSCSLYDFQLLRLTWLWERILKIDRLLLSQVFHRCGEAPDTFPWVNLKRT